MYNNTYIYIYIYLFICLQAPSSSRPGESARTWGLFLRGSRIRHIYIYIYIYIYDYDYCSDYYYFCYYSECKNPITTITLTITLFTSIQLLSLILLKGTLTSSRLARVG